jgi:arylsulfatase A-like enzyme
VLAKLDELRLRNNTLVIFTSDNGGLSTSEGWPTSNVPLRGGKGWMYEGGIRTPLLVRWPAKIKPETIISTPVSSPDFFPTLLEIAGATPQPGQTLDGLSLVPLFTGGTLPERALYWHYPHYGNQGGAPGAAIRRGDWKLIEWMEEGRSELFNLANDLSERHDQAFVQTRRVTELVDELHVWQTRVRARFPSPNTDYDPAKPSGRAATRKPTSG